MQGNITLRTLQEPAWMPSLQQCCSQITCSLCKTVMCTRTCTSQQLGAAEAHLGFTLQPMLCMGMAMPMAHLQGECLRS